MEFGKLFQDIRKFRGMTQKEAAEKLSITNAQLSRIETGKQDPGLELTAKAAMLYQVGYKYFFSEKRIFANKSIELTGLINSGIALELDNQPLSDMELKGLIAFLKTAHSNKGDGHEKGKSHAVD